MSEGTEESPIPPTPPGRPAADAQQNFPQRPSPPGPSSAGPNPPPPPSTTISTSLPSDPGYAPGYPISSPPKKRRAWPWIVGVLAIIGLGIGKCSYDLVGKLVAPVDTANEYLTAVQMGDFEAAWELSEPSCFVDGSPDKLKELMPTQTLISFDLTETSIGEVDEEATSEVGGTATYSEVGATDVTIFLVKPDEWKVCGIHIGVDE